MTRGGTPKSCTWVVRVGFISTGHRVFYTYESVKRLLKDNG